VNSGIRWLPESQWFYCVTFARGISPEDLATRLGAAPNSPRPQATAADVIDLLSDPNVGIARIGEASGWAFAAEYGEAQGTRKAVLEGISRDGIDVVSLDPQAAHPPPMFYYARDGELVCAFGLGEEWRRWGQQPGILNSAMEAAGIIIPGGGYLQVEGRRHNQRIAMSLGVIEKHFSLSLPRQVLEDGALPAVAVSGGPDLGALVDDW
jgi:hypothetical protein